MSASVTDIAELRRMIAEPTTATYSDVLLASLIERRVVPDARGVDPLVLDYTTSPPTWTASTLWIPTYDLNACAADIWEEKAAAVACQIDYTADGASNAMSQRHKQFSATAQRFRSRSCPGALRMARVELVRDASGGLVEMTPIVDRAQYSNVLNAPESPQ